MMGYQAERASLINTFDPPKEIKEEVDSYENNFWLPKHSNSTNLVLYHYTTAEGMKGIIDHRSFWCTDINFLNDKQEIKYGKKIIIDRLNNFIANEHNESIKSLLTKLKEVIGIHNIYDTFIFCMSKENHLLYQWEYYANHGKGYNLGFIFNIEFNNKTKISYDLNNLSENKHPVLRKVIYEIEEQFEIVDLYINSIIKGTKNILAQNNYSDKSWISIASLYVSNILLEMLCSLKSPSYKEEQEWRLVYMIQKTYKPELCNFRIRDNILIPFLNMYLYNDVQRERYFPLQSINIGPMLSEDYTKSSIDKYLQSTFNLSQSPIKISKDIAIKKVEKLN